MSQDGHPSSRHALYVGSSSGGASGSKSVALVRTEKEDEVPLSTPIDMISAVKEFHALSKEDLSKLIKDGKNGNIQWTKADGTSFEINVKDMARKLPIHLVGYYLESKQDEELFKYLLAGVRLLHTLCDLAPRHRQLEKVFFEETEASRQTAYLVSFMICFLHNTGEKIDASSAMVHLHSALLASTLYLFKSITYGQWKWNDHALLLDFLPEVNVLTCQAFQAVGSVIKFLQVKLVRMQSSDDEVYHLFQLFEASLQFLYSLSQEKIFHEREIDQNKVTEAVKYDESLVDQKVKVWWPEDKVFYEGVVTSFNADTKEHQVLYLDEEQEILNLKTETWEPIQKYSVHNKVLCEGGVVLKLVQDIMKLPECEDSYLTACIYRLKTKALYIMLYLCGAANSSFSMNQGLDIAKSTLSEVLEVLKKMFGEELKDHPRGNLQLNAMRIADLFADDINFRSYIVLNLTESLTRVFTQPHKEFLRNWCSSERDPIEEDVHLEFDSVAAAGEILGVIPRLDVSKYTYSTSRALHTPYAHQKSSLLIKIIAHLTCFNSDTPKEEKGLLVNKFFQILQMEHPNLTNGAACSSGERAAVTFKNLHSFLAHAGSLVPEYNLQVDVNHLRLFIKKLEALVAPQVSHSRHVKEVYETSECPLHSPMVKTHSLFVSDNVDDHSEDAVMEDHTETQHNGTLVTIPQQDGSSMGVRNSFGRMATAEVDPQEEKQPKKRKNRLMNDIQVAMIRNALKDDMHWDAKTRELWAVKLSAHGSEITSKQLDNWLDYHFKRKPARARAAAKDGDTASPTSHGIHHKDIKAPATLKNCGGESSKTVTGVSPTSSSKHEHGQCVMLIDEKGQEIGQGSIYLTKGVWFKKNLEELSLCVVDVNELKVAKETELPHECDGTGSSFATAEMILSKMRVLWDSSKLLLIQQQA